MTEEKSKNIEDEIQQSINKVEVRLSKIAINSSPYGLPYTIKDLKKVEKKLLNKEVCIDQTIGSIFFAKVTYIDISNDLLQVELQTWNNKHVYVDLGFDNIRTISYYDNI